VKGLIIALLLSTLLTSCQHLKNADQLARGASQYQLYEFNAYECYECKRRRLLLELTIEKKEIPFEH